MKIELLIDGKNVLGEGPLWDVEEQMLYWIDSLGKKVFRIREDGSEYDQRDVPEEIGSAAIRKKGGMILSLANGFHFFDFQSGNCEFLLDPEENEPRTRLNDGKVDKKGRFVVGSMDKEQQGPVGGLYRLDPDLSCVQLEGDITCSNGPCWSPDGKKFYFTDSWTEDIVVYDYDLETGSISNKKDFSTTRGREGVPDGSTVDSEGYLWNAQVYGGLLVRYAPDGSIDRQIEMPVKKITSVMFGGPNLDVIYVTSMARPYNNVAPNEKGAGGLYAVRGLGIRGVPEPRFGG